MNSHDKVHNDLKDKVGECASEIRRIFNRQPRWKTLHLYEQARKKFDREYGKYQLEYTNSHFSLAMFKLMEEGFLHWDDDGFLRPGPHPVKGPLREY